jgi:hypothetical protein
MKGYYMQEALYSAMMYEMFGFFAPKIITLVATEETGFPDVFEQRAADHLPAAIDLVAQFYAKAAADVSKI